MQAFEIYMSDNYCKSNAYLKQGDILINNNGGKYIFELGLLKKEVDGQCGPKTWSYVLGIKQENIMGQQVICCPIFRQKSGEKWLCTFLQKGHPVWTLYPPSITILCQNRLAYIWAGQVVGEEFIDDG